MTISMYAPPRSWITTAHRAAEVMNWLRNPAQRNRRQAQHAIIKVRQQIRDTTDPVTRVLLLDRYSDLEERLAALPSCADDRQAHSTAARILKLAASTELGLVNPSSSRIEDDDDLPGGGYWWRQQLTSETHRSRTINYQIMANDRNLKMYGAAHSYISSIFLFLGETEPAKPAGTSSWKTLIKLLYKATWLTLIVLIGVTAHSVLIPVLVAILALGAQYGEAVARRREPWISTRFRLRYIEGSRTLATLVHVAALSAVSSATAVVTGTSDHPGISIVWVVAAGITAYLLGVIMIDAPGRRFG